MSDSIKSLLDSISLFFSTWEVKEFLSLAALLMSILALFVSIRLSKKQRDQAFVIAKQKESVEFYELLGKLSATQARMTTLLNKEKKTAFDVEKILKSLPDEIQQLGFVVKLRSTLSVSHAARQSHQDMVSESEGIAFNFYEQDPTQESWKLLSQHCSKMEADYIKIESGLANLVEARKQLAEVISGKNLT